MAIEYPVVIRVAVNDAAAAIARVGFEEVVRAEIETPDVAVRVRVGGAGKADAKERAVDEVAILLLGGVKADDSLDAASAAGFTGKSRRVTQAQADSEKTVNG